MYRHLTNSAVSRKHRDYVKTNDEFEGSKRSFAFLEGYLCEHANLTDPRLLWRRIRNLIVKTIILAAPHIYHGYRLFHRSDDYYAVSSGSTTTTTTTTDNTVGGLGGRGVLGNPKDPIQSAAFEILGFDVLLDTDLKPWLLEVNRSPSFGVDQGLDSRVKAGLLRDALTLVNIRVSDKRRSEERQRAHAVRRLWNPTATVMPLPRDVTNVARKPSIASTKAKCLTSEWLKNPKELLNRIKGIVGPLISFHMRGALHILLKSRFFSS